MTGLLPRCLGPSRLLLAVPCLLLLTGCLVLPVRAAFDPVQGPLAAQHPVPSFQARVTGAFSGHVTVTLGQGKVFKGEWHPVKQGQLASAPGQVSLSPQDWDFVYGAGYYRASVLGSRLFARASLSGSAGSTALVEFYNPDNRPGHTHGVARDSRGNLYKVTVYN